MKFIDTKWTCDICFQNRKHGDHTQCSKTRQKRYAAERDAKKSLKKQASVKEL